MAPILSDSTESSHDAACSDECFRADARLILGDALAVLPTMQDASFDLAIADPPYGASTQAAWTLPKGHDLPRFGGRWQLASHDWDLLTGDESFRFTVAWLAELRRLVRPTGSIWLHATYHNAGFLNVGCQLLGIEIINEVVWYKRNAFPNLSGRRLTASHESLLWVHTGTKRRDYHFNYDDVKEATFDGDSFKKAGKQLRTVWDIPNNKTKDEREHGGHPTQKPLRLTDRLFLIAGNPGGSVLVPFMGSGTEMVSALRHDMLPTGIELDRKWYDVACSRVDGVTRRPALPATL
ncbi:MAG: DNA-methyltransferase [Solirubrobacteraceae bacterium]